MNLIVREVREDDARDIVDLLNPIIRDGKYTIMEEPMTVGDQIGFLRGLLERGIYHLAAAERSGEVLGVQDVQPHSLATPALRHIGEISTFVALAARRSGVGKTLTRETLRRVPALGYRKLMAAIRADNPQAIAFYESQGFEKIGEAREHALVRGEYIDEVLMEMLIPSRKLGESRQ